MLTRNIASEYGEYNIQCNGMGPGYIATAQTAPLREIQPDGSRHPFDTFICAKTPAGRWGTPEDMVGPCVFLASHASDFVNGQILYADGGSLAYIGKQPKYVKHLEIETTLSFIASQCRPSLLGVLAGISRTERVFVILFTLL